MASIYSAGSASVNIVPDFSNAQRRIGEWFARQKDMKVQVKPDLDSTAMVKTVAEVEAHKPKLHIDIDRKEFSKKFVEAVDFLTGTSLVQKALLRLFDVKPILLANLAGAGTALASSLSGAIGAVALAPAAVAALVAPISAAIVGFQGIGSAFSSFGDPKKLAEAMKNLAPAARDFVTQTHNLAGAWKDLRLDVQERLFSGLADKMTALGDKGLPVLRKGLAGMADELNVLIGGVMDSLTSGGNLADIGHIFDNLKTVFHELAISAKPFFDSLIDITSVGSDALVPLTRGLGDAAQKFADFIQKSRDSGDLAKFISTGLSSIGDLLTIVGHLGSSIGGIFKAALPAGTALMGLLKDFTGDLSKFLHTGTAQSGLRLFFDGAYQAIQAILPALKALVAAMVTSVLPAMAGFAKAVAPIVNDVLVQFANLLETLGPLFYPALAQALQAAFGALAPLISVFEQLARTILPPVISLIEDLAPRFSALAEAVGEGVVKAVKALAPLLPKIHDAFVAIVDALTPMVKTTLDLANDVLPPLVSVLGFLFDIIKKIAPVLPFLLTGFLAFKAVDSVAGILGNFGKTLGGIAAKLGSGAIAEVAGRTGQGLSLIASMAGPAALGIGFVVTEFVLWNEAAQKVNELSIELGKNLGNLGKSGQQVRDALKPFDEIQALLNGDVGLNFGFGDLSGLQKAIGGITLFGHSLNDLIPDTKQAQAAWDSYWHSLPVGEQATERVAYWTQELTRRRKEFGDGSPEVEAAQRRLAYWNGVGEQSEKDQADATQKTIDKIKEKRDTIMGEANAQLNYENSQAALKTATDEYVKSLDDWTLSEDEHNAKEREFRAAALDAADAAYTKAQADNAGKSQTEITKAANDAYLQSLIDTADALGDRCPQAIRDLIASLQAGATNADYTKSKFEELGFAVKAVPDDKTVVVSAPTEKQKQDLRDLGYVVETLPNGDIVVTADTHPAQAEIAAVVSAKYNAYVALHLTNSGSDVVNAVRNIEHAGGAIGGIVERYANGGLRSLFPMQGGVATVVKPNTWRIIGDRVKDDEAYIPINDSARSQKILDTTADRMGYDIVPKATGGFVLPPGMLSTFSRDSATLAATADAVRRSQPYPAIGGGATQVAGFVNNGTVLTADLSEITRRSRIGTQRALATAGLS